MGHKNTFTLTFLVITFIFLLPVFSNTPPKATPFKRMLALVQQEPVILKYHNGPLLKGNVTVSVHWYGHFTPTQRSIIIDFFQSLNTSSATHQHHHPPSPSAFSWWQTTATYRGGPCTLIVGDQTLDDNYSLGKTIKTTELISLASKSKKTSNSNNIHVLLTASDVEVEDFCMNQCGTHLPGRVEKGKTVYAWVGNPMSQCPGECAWPFHQPLYGPQSPPLVAPNGDVGVDGMVISLATVLAGAVTNPFSNGYYQGVESAPLEAVSACTGIFGKDAYPGYPGNVLVDNTTGASYNAVGVNGRKFLLPAMWDPITSKCKALV
ncbi:unnamed protein product [Lupinus luteus]|uniref:Protein EXORDIUM-like 2 n=1 Tax=Lupinus luteus TaxID=3873 RepID=A0AAV1W8V4_LUPLU